MMMISKKTTTKKPILTEIDWTKVKSGTWFTTKIDTNNCIGKIQKENDSIFLCQNNQDGADCKNKLGFMYSWSIDNGSITDLKENIVRNLIILPSKPKDYKIDELIAGHKITYHKNYIMVGCTKITNNQIKRIVSRLK